jgi:hypothetical protein
MMILTKIFAAFALLPLCVLALAVQPKTLLPELRGSKAPESPRGWNQGNADYVAEHSQQKRVVFDAVEAAGMLAYQFLLAVEVIVLAAIYVFVGVNTADYVSRSLHCLWSLAVLINAFLWPITVPMTFLALALQQCKRHFTSWSKPTAAESDSVKFDQFLSIVNRGTPQFCNAKLTEKFGGLETVTPKCLGEKLQIPEVKALRWHKWLARGNPELSLNMLLCRAAELHKADGKKICRILFEVHDENDDGVLPRSEAKEVLLNWCTCKYGTTCLSSSGMEQVIETLMGQISYSGGDINKIEWMKLAERCPEFFETEPQSPEHVRYLRLLCRVRMEQNGYVMRLAAK